jgi:hypothetical protein
VDQNVFNAHRSISIETHQLAKAMTTAMPMAAVHNHPIAYIDPNLRV